MRKYLLVLVLALSGCGAAEEPLEVVYASGEVRTNFEVEEVEVPRDPSEGLLQKGRSLRLDPNIEQYKISFEVEPKVKVYAYDFEYKLPSGQNSLIASVVVVDEVVRISHPPDKLSDDRPPWSKEFVARFWVEHPGYIEKTQGPQGTGYIENLGLQLYSHPRQGYVK
ncbi:hypothetical protein JKY72_02620 [Candidatus Gracilibacteria bacterium]|nr:hypothetical protein [Candidatus Gracilibacteria bacterium]